MKNKIVNGKDIILLKLDVVIKKEGEYYVAYCPAIEITGYGKTVEEAQNSFDIELEIFVEETQKNSTLEKYLLKNGWRLQQTPQISYEPPKQDISRLSSLLKSSESSVTHKEVAIPAGR
jgi:predicted RNase H-like HicB family nuclease